MSNEQYFTLITSLARRLSKRINRGLFFFEDLKSEMALALLSTAPVFSVVSAYNIAYNAGRRFVYRENKFCKVHILDGRY